MGYKVLYDNQLLFDPYTDDRITDTKLSSKLNAASYFDFTIAPTHSLYSKLKERAGEVRIYFNNLILFKGEITKIDEDFEGNYSVSCTGVLDYLTATRVRPYSTVEGEQPLKAPSSFDGYFQWLIDQHNSNCLDSRKHFSVGVNQGNMLDKNNYIYRSSEQRPTTASEIEDKILNSNGGYLFVRYQDDLNILDLYADVHDVNTQIIDYGVNMLDFTKTTTTEGQYTAVVATGYTPNPPEGQTGTKMKPITLEGCTDGGTPYSSTIVKMGDRVYDVEAVKRYGYHEYYASNTDITTYDGLLYYACKTLNTLLSPALTISVKAVDLALIMGEKYKHLLLGQAVRIRSKPRKVDEYLMVNSIDLDLMNPDNTTFDLGASYDTLTGQQSAYLKSLNASINASLDTVSALGDNVKNSAKLAQEAKDAANTASTNATYAMNKAEAANTNASSAVKKAESATTKANEATTKAEAATTKATEATTKAEDATAKANEATAKADLVDKKAEEAKSAADGAKQAADEANTAAGNAQTSADNANQAATEAKNSADEANTAAGNAQSTANSALSSAAQANKDVSGVKTQITEINKEITSVKQDASTLRDDLTGQITTVKETMEADYAKKSELSDTETNLRTEISKSAAGIRTEVSQTYSTKKELETTTKAAQTAQSTADAAKKAAESNASDLANAVSKFDGDISGLKDQIDGAIQTWFYDGIPNALTEPEIHWTTDTDRQTHLGDLYYDNQTGFCYRYMNQNGVYSWKRILDTDITKALSDAAKAQTTANAKKRIFITTPTPPYDIGDLWVQGSTGDILNCQTPKIASQAYAESDWVKASKYTDDTAVTKLSNTVEKTYATKSTVNQLSDRIEQTVSSVEEVRTDASAAKTTADKAQKAADAASAAAKTAHDTATAAQTKATAAAGAAATAQTAADEAKKNATSAASAAATAQTKANAAQTAADAAKANASAAQTAADAANADLVTAKKNLEDLQGRADATDTEIAAAKSAVTKAQTAADAANSAASKANSAAATAQSTANTAKANAATAQSKANEASKAATTAQSTADTAKANAATAQSKANAAASAASTAQSTADIAKANAKKAQDDVNALKNRVTSAETKITQNSEEIALRATKTEVTTAIDNINVGGSNLLTNTANSSITTTEAVESTNGPNYGMATERFHAAAGKVVTISCEVEMVDFVYSRRVGTGFSYGSDFFGVWFKEGADGSTKNNIRKRVYFTFTLPSEANSWTGFGAKNCYIQGAISGKCTVRNPKLELGNKPTDWSPAPEDLVSESKTYTDAQLKVTSDSITSTVSKTYATKTDLSTTNSNVTKAQSTADTAKANAATAQSTADTAKANAATAQSTANTAKTNASTAQSTANTAKANAKKAQDDVDALDSRVTSAETSITQNSDAIALRATKTEVNDALTSAKSYTDAQLKITSEGITSSVSKTYATKTELSTTNSNVTAAKKDADTAQSTANTGVANAKAAQNTANTAVANAKTAQSTADTAKANAKTAQDTADGVKADLKANYTTTTDMESKISQSAEGITSTVSKTYATKAAVEALKNIADNAIESWSGTGVPTLTNKPASDWTTDALKKQHLGDLYYDKATSYGYRFNQNGSSYSWDLIRDTGITQALADAAAANDAAKKAQSTANSGLSKANAAQSTANSASTAASNAQTTANTAKANAATAQADVDKLKTDIPNTYATKSSLTQTAEAITAKVETAQSTADGAVTAASKAQQTANSISTTLSKNYTTTADADKKYATQSSLTQTAKSLTSKISSVETATAKAQADATSAIGKADQAHSDVGSLKTRMSTAETTIKQNTDAIALRATKTEVTNGLATKPDLGQTVLTYSLVAAANLSKYWVRLGTLVSKGDNSTVSMHVLTGNGYNGSASQNSEFWIYIKDGYASGSSTKWFGGTVDLGLNCTNVDVKLFASDQLTCDIWVKLPWAYPMGDYTIQGRYKSWTPNKNKDNQAETPAPSGQIEQDVAIRTIAPTSYVDAQIKVSADRITSTVSSVRTIAETAKSTADTAKANAVTATTTANTAKSTADTAKKAADSASSTANEAATNAATAKSDASTAKITANTAKSTADTAKKNAATAQSTADTAQSTANDVKDDLAKNYSTTTEMNSSINQTAESIKSSVAATYVNNETLSSYATKSQLEQTSTSLTASIQTTNTTVSGLETTVKKVNDYMTFGSESGHPTLTIGSSSSSFRTKLTNTSEKFMQGDQTIMELDGVTSTVKASRVQMGHYQWRDTGTSMQLVYIP